MDNNSLKQINIKSTIPKNDQTLWKSQTFTKCSHDENRKMPTYMTENTSLKQINKIASTISEYDQQVWAYQASTKCYNDEKSKLEDEELRLTKEIHNINKQIEESKPVLDILEKCYEVQNKTMEISLESLVTDRLYKKYLEEKVNKHRRECDSLREEFSEHIDKCKTKLEHTNPLFKILQEKRVELKKSKMRCLDFQQRLKGIKLNIEQRHQIQKQIFHTGIISLAKIWLDEKRHSDELKELQELKQHKRDLMLKVMERTKQLKVKENTSRDLMTLIPQNQFSKKPTNDVNNLRVNSNDTPTTDNNEKPSMNPLKHIEGLFGERKSDTNSALTHQINHLPNDKAICPRVRILENKTLKLPYVPQKVQTLSKEKISKAIDAKLQRVTQNFKRSMSRQRSRKLLIDDNKNTQMTNTQKSSKEANKKLTEETNQNQTGATQNLESLNILSQETYMAINILSQDSVTGSSAESKLKNFKYLSSDNRNKNLEDLTNAQKDMHPQKMDVDIHANGSSQETKENIETIDNNLFKTNDGREQFSINFAEKSFENPFKNTTKDVSSKTNIFSSTGARAILNTTGNTSNFSQPFKMNKDYNTDGVFKVPEVAPSNNFLSQSTQNSMIASGTLNAPKHKNSENSSVHEGNGFFDTHGTQYEFGNTMKQISEIPNDSYDLAWSPPAPDLSNDSPMDNNPLFSFGQSKTNFGFSFFK